VRTPRDVTGSDLVKALKVLGYERVRQEGSHIRLSTQQGGEFHVTVPNHSPMRLGTFKSIIKLIAVHHGMTPEELIGKLEL
jgi:predicted RNA binding protein YcfA (HicA-like mRNA interferase family)